jgi:Flp pilus assembly protein TadB
MSSELGPHDPRPNKDWIQIWFQMTQSNIQWAKGQSWNAVQWTVLLIAALFAASVQYTAISACVWVIGALIIAAVSTWWQIDLHLFARSARLTSEGLISSLKERDEYLPKRSGDTHHVTLLVVRIILVWAGAALTILQIVSTH